VGKDGAKKRDFVKNVEIEFRKPPRHPPTLKAHLHGEYPRPKHLGERKNRMTHSKRTLKTLMPLGGQQKP
jgi:hypothetical protein